MKINKLKLENFRGFTSLELNLHPEVTVLVGVNGSGKTTVLDAIVQMLRWGLLKEKKIPSVQCRVGATNYSITIEVEHNGTSAQGFY
jgi:recombinational DNA repair ATPase RecF